MSVQLLLSQKGPLPITVNFKAPSDAPIFLEVNGSVWTQTANTLIGIQVELDGVVLGVAQIFSNTAATHRAVVPAYFPVQLKYGVQHTLTLNVTAGSKTVSDFNDFFTAVLHF